MKKIAVTINSQNIEQAFPINSKNVEQAIWILVPFISEVNPQKEKYLAKYDCFLADICVHFEPLLGWKCAYICYHLRTEKEDI